MKLVWLIVLIALLVWIFVRARRQAGDPRRRRFIIKRAVVMVPVGLAIGLLLPQRVPMNNESPAGIVVYLLCWVIGGVMVLQAAVSLLAAFLPRPKV